MSRWINDEAWNELKRDLERELNNGFNKLREELRSYIQQLIAQTLQDVSTIREVNESTSDREFDVDVKQLYEKYKRWMDDMTKLNRKKWTIKRMKIKNVLPLMKEKVVIMKITPQKFSELMRYDNLLEQEVDIIEEDPRGKGNKRIGQSLYYTVSLLRKLSNQ